jgi:hypothetical protein
MIGQASSSGRGIRRGRMAYKSTSYTTGPVTVLERYLLQVKQLERSLGRLLQEHQEALHTFQPIGFLRRWIGRILRSLKGRNNRKYIVDGLAKALYVKTRATIAICIMASVYHSFRIFQRCGQLLSNY